MGSAADFPVKAIEALRRLKAAQDAGDILVARTSRLIEYAVSRDGLRFETARDASGKTTIDILGIDDAVRGAQARTLTGYAALPSRPRGADRSSYACVESPSLARRSSNIASPISAPSVLVVCAGLHRLFP